MRMSATARPSLAGNKNRKHIEKDTRAASAKEEETEGTKRGQRHEEICGDSDNVRVGHDGDTHGKDMPGGCSGDTGVGKDCQEGGVYVHPG